MPKPAPAAPAPLLQPRRSTRPRPAPAPLPAAVPTGEARYTVQVGAFSQLENSQATVAELARRGYEPYVVELRSSRGGVLHTVRVGRYPDRGAAARAASDLRRKERMEAIVQRVSPGVAGAGAAEKASATS
jgi:cell division septation protein DedD